MSHLGGSTYPVSPGFELTFKLLHVLRKPSGSQPPTSLERLPNCGRKTKQRLCHATPVHKQRPQCYTLAGEYVPVQRITLIFTVERHESWTVKHAGVIGSTHADGTLALLKKKPNSSIGCIITWDNYGFNSKCEAR